MAHEQLDIVIEKDGRRVTIRATEIVSIDGREPAAYYGASSGGDETIDAGILQSVLERLITVEAKLDVVERALFADVSLVENEG